MIKKTITYKNFEKEITKEFYFGLFEADFVELEALWIKEGGFDGRVDRVKKGDDPTLILETFKLLIARSFGVRTEDDEFYRPEKERERFMSSDAYSVLLVGLLTKDGPEWDASAFMQGILPDSTETTMNAGDNPAAAQARARMEAQMQGYLKPKRTPKDEGFEKVELPTAEPVLPPLEDDPEFLAFLELKKAQEAREQEKPALTPDQIAFLEFKNKQ